MYLKKILIFTCFIILSIGLSNPISAFAEVPPEAKPPSFTSSPNSVGSGARALGMGGAFIAVADDATSASWNPGGLIQLEKPEFSIVGTWFHRSEDNEFDDPGASSGLQSLSEGDINYLSLAYRFSLLNRNMIISLNYQNLYDFSREWDITIAKNIESNVDHTQDGTLSALGLAYCIEIVPEFSFGFTLNFWKDGLSPNEWERTTTTNFSGTTTGGLEFYGNTFQKDEYSFEGFNINLGFLWHLTDKLTLGAVLKTPFTADLEYEKAYSDLVIFPTNPDLNDQTPLSSQEYDEELEMPMSYGIGLSYNFSKQFTLSADIYRTEWQDFIIKGADGVEKSAVSGNKIHESNLDPTDPNDKLADIDPTYQFRIGAEYLFINPEKEYVIPIRGGIFYDPAPAEESPDDFFGFSLGSGIAISRYLFDIAYQYRYGNDVGKYMIPNLGLSQDVEEHTIYTSLIIHF
ncbi:long-chain fatty acid transport protein [Candidatus Magnetomoraceae bacterium gMMP-15]